jgi:hypothetical protein
VIIKDLLASSLLLKYNKQVMEIRDNSSDPKVKLQAVATIDSNSIINLLRLSSTTGHRGLVRAEYW